MVFIVDRLKRMFGFVLFLHILSIFQLTTWILINANACNAKLLFGASSSSYSLKCFNSLFLSIFWFLFFFATDCFRSPQFISLKLLFSLFVTSNESRPIFSCYVKHLLSSFIMNETDISGSDVCCFFLAQPFCSRAMAARHFFFFYYYYFSTAWHENNFGQIILLFRFSFQSLKINTQKEVSSFHQQKK